MSEILVNTIKKADGTGGLTIPTGTGTVATLAGGTYTGAIAMGANNISFSNGNGIDFSASEGSGADSSVLDDYEEGTFTPNVSDGGSGSMTASNKVGVYRKIGSLVYVSMYITGITKSGSGGLSVTGLPFTIAATNDACDYTGECRWDDINTDTQMLPYFESGTATIDFQQFNSTGYNGGVTINDCSSSFALYNVTGTYITSD